MTLFFCSGCIQAAPKEEIIADINISLDEKKCIIKIDNKTFIIEMKPNCYFVKHSNTGDTRVKYYKDIDAHVVLVSGSSAVKDPKYPLTLKRNDCGTQIQALIIKKGIPQLSSKIFSHTRICAGLGADEKEYYILSHP